MNARTFQTIGLLGKQGDPEVADAVRALAQRLVRLGRRLLLDADTAETVRLPDVPACTREALGADADLLIVIGGDGTLLHAARRYVEFDLPMLGVNLGRLGFLVEWDPEQLPERIEAVLGGDYREERRFLLEAEVLRNGAVVESSTALNDVVLHKLDVARMIEIETHLDGEFVNCQRSDGLIVATPTGSTAYALSGGGPIVEPELDAIVLVPICPHTLSFRPLVIGGDQTVEMTLVDGNRAIGQVTCDGQVHFTLQPGDRVRVRKHRHVLHLLQPTEHDYFQVLRMKLGWGNPPVERGPGAQSAPKARRAPD